MSDLSAAAAALGLPEALVERSAAARSAETGASVDEVLAEWAGGEAAPRAEPATDAAADTPVPETSDEEPAAPPAVSAAPAPEVVIEIPQQTQTSEPLPAGPYKPPVLVGTRDNPLVVLAGVIGLFLMVIMVGLVGPSLADDAPGERTSAIALSETAVAGRDVYATAGCASCHTQMVRPVIADVGLGAVTLHDTNQVLGTRRFGPDLSDIGTRITGAQIESIITGLGGHPAHTLSTEELESLVAYLSEARTSAGDGAGS